MYTLPYDNCCHECIKRCIHRLSTTFKSLRPHDHSKLQWQHPPLPQLKNSQERHKIPKALT